MQIFQTIVKLEAVTFKNDDTRERKVVDGIKGHDACRCLYYEADDVDALYLAQFVQAPDVHYVVIEHGNFQHVAPATDVEKFVIKKTA